jgi:hypothetical protein
MSNNEGHWIGRSRAADSGASASTLFSDRGENIPDTLVDSGSRVARKDGPHLPASLKLLTALIRRSRIKAAEGFRGVVREDGLGYLNSVEKVPILDSRLRD